MREYSAGMDGGKREASESDKKAFSDVGILCDVFRYKDGKTYIKTPSGLAQEVIQNEPKTTWQVNEENLIPIDENEEVIIVDVLKLALD